MVKMSNNKALTLPFKQPRCRVTAGTHEVVVSDTKGR